MGSKKWIFLCVFICMLILFFGCGKEDLNTVRIGYMPISANAPLFVGIENNIYKDFGLDCELKSFQSSVNAIYALQRNEVDVVFAPPINNIVDALNKAPKSMQIIAIHGNDESHYFEGFIVPSNSTIEKLEQFKEGTVGCFPGNFAEKTVNAILSKSVDMSKITIRPLNFGAQLGSLEAGSVDLLFAYEPLITISTTKGMAKIIQEGPLTKNFFTPFPVSGVCISIPFVRKKPKIAELFVKANNKVMEKIYRDPSIMLGAVASFTKIEPDIAKKLHHCYYLPITEVQKKSTLKVIDLFLKLGIIEKIPDTESLFYSNDDND